MRKTTMLRKTLTILSLIGLLLSVGLWGVSFFAEMGIIFNADGKSINLTTYKGGVQWETFDYPQRPREDYWKWSEAVACVLLVYGDEQC